MEKVMSYSRWSDSRWYTYWSVSSGPTKDEQLFSICLDGGFTYKELKDDLEGCLNIIRERSEKERLEFAPDSPAIPEEDYEELRRYMQIFLQDVDANYERFMVEEVAQALEDAATEVARMIGLDK